MEVLLKQETTSRKSGAKSLKDGLTSSLVLPSAPSESVVFGEEGVSGKFGNETVAEADMIFSTSTGTCTFMCVNIHCVHVRYM